MISLLQTKICEILKNYVWSQVTVFILDLMVNLYILRIFKRLQVDVPASLSIRFASDNLESLKLILKEKNSKFPYDYIEKYPMIRQLFLHDRFGYLGEVNMSRIASLLPLLERIIFDCRIKISINEIIPHLTKFQSLEEIPFYNLEHVEYHDLVPLLIDEANSI